MQPEIIEAENNLNNVLSQGRQLYNLPAGLQPAAIIWSQAIWDEAERRGAMILSDAERTNGLNLSKFPVFICGVHRSGTTLLRDLLDGHNDLVVLPSEGTFYTNLQTKLYGLPTDKWAEFLTTEWLRRLANPINQAPYWLLGRSTTKASPYIDFARYAMAWWPLFKSNKNTQWPHTAIILAYAACTGKTNAKFWVDKTPCNERFLKRIWQEAPETKIIHVIREPLATLASRKKMEPGVSMRRALMDLKTSYRVAVSQPRLNEQKFLLVRYEELVENPIKVMGKIAKFLNIPFSEILTQPTVAGLPSQANSSFNLQAAPGQIIKQNKQPKQDGLTETEKLLLSACIGRLSNKLGYPLTKAGFIKRLCARLINRLW